ADIGAVQNPTKIGRDVLGLERDALVAGRNVGVESNPRPRGRRYDARRLVFADPWWPDWLRTLEEPLRARRLHCLGEVDPRPDETGRRYGHMAYPRFVEVRHDFQPHGGGAGDATHVPHRLAREVAHPHADGVVLGVADAPIVAHVLARSCL